MARRTSTAWVVMEKPATRASPEEAGNKVVSILMVVVLPAPLEPSKPKTSPALTDRVRASTAVKAPKRRVRACRSKTISFIRKPGRNYRTALITASNSAGGDLACGVDQGVSVIEPGLSYERNRLGS